MNEPNDTLLEKNYWKLSADLSIEKRFNPTNLVKAKFEFLESFARKSPINPTFEYNHSKINFEEVFEKFKELQRGFLSQDFEFSSFYLDLIKFDVQRLKVLQSQQKTGVSSNGELSELYGKTSPDLLEKATQLLSEIGGDSIERGSLSSADALHVFNSELESRGFEHWNVTTEDTPAKASVNSSTKTVTLRRDAYFTAHEIKRLVTHEIDVHVRRFQNGCTQPNSLFKFGFPNYLKTEEGLAITAEYKSDLMTNNDLRTYCSRVIACNYSLDVSFYDLFNLLLEFNDLQTAFDITARVKRGLIDTSRKDGYTKDHVYLDGFLEIRDLPNYKLKALYCGKIGLSDLDFLERIPNLNLDYSLPSWLRN